MNAVMESNKKIALYDERGQFSTAELRRLREALNMTQNEMAIEVGVDYTTINRWENGHQVPTRLARKALEGLATRVNTER